MNTTNPKPPLYIYTQAELLLLVSKELEQPSSSKENLPKTSIAEGIGELLRFYGDFECPADSAKSAERMAGAFEFYWSNYPLGTHDDHGNRIDPVELPGGKRAIEVNFAEPLPIAHPDTGDPLIYCGRLDAILNYAGGRYITDEKTTTQLGASWSRQWDLRSQFTGYAWGARQIGIKVDGALVRGISILKTKYDTQQAISYRPDWVIDRWYAEMLWWVSQLVEAYKRDVWIHNFDHACAEYGGCQFREACSDPGRDSVARNLFRTSRVESATQNRD